MEYSWRFTDVWGNVARLLTNFSRDVTADRTRALLSWLNVVRTWVLEGIPYSLGLLACPSGWHWISNSVFVSYSTLSAPSAGQWRKVTVVQMGLCLHRSVLPRVHWRRTAVFCAAFFPILVGPHTFDGFLAERMCLHLLWSELPVLCEDLNFVTRPRMYLISIWSCTAFQATGFLCDSYPCV
jgi:hypothetical protein